MTIVISDLKHARQFGHSIHTAAAGENLERYSGPTASESYESIFIIPGTNFFERDVEAKWLRIRNSQACKGSIAELIEEGTLREVTPKSSIKKTDKTAKGSKAGKGSEKADKTPSTLEEFDAKMAVDIVKGTADVENLEEWLSNETRSAVQVALKAQIKIVSGIDKARKAAQDEQG